MVAIHRRCIYRYFECEAIRFCGILRTCRILEAKSCAPDRVAEQWIKGAKHASNPFFVEIAATGLIRSSPKEIPLLVTEALDQIVLDEPWFEANLSSVQNRIRIKIAPASEKGRAPQSEAP